MSEQPEQPTVTKEVLILQGPQGAGKSTLTKQFPHAKVCSADSYFETPEGYKHDASKLKEAHGACLRSFIDAILAGASDPNPTTIIVDNTHSQRWEMAPYVQIAKAYGFEVEVHTFIIDPKVAFFRNAHNTPWENVLRTWVFMETPLATWGRHTIHLPDGSSFSNKLGDPEPEPPAAHPSTD